jgi:hypothetical protein
LRATIYTHILHKYKMISQLVDFLGMKSDLKSHEWKMIPKSLLRLPTVPTNAIILVLPDLHPRACYFCCCFKLLCPSCDFFYSTDTSRGMTWKLENECLFSTCKSWSNVQSHTRVDLRLETLHEHLSNIVTNCSI